MVEETGIRAKFIPTIDEDAMRQMMDDFTRRMDELSGGMYSEPPESPKTPKATTPTAGEETGILGKIFGEVASSAKELLKISALATLVYSSVKAIMDAPMMKMFFAQFTQAFNLFFMPFGNFLGMFLMPLSMALMETAVKFNMWVGEGGLIYGMRMLLREFLIWLGEIIVFDIVKPIIDTFVSMFEGMYDSLVEMGDMLVGAFKSGWEALKTGVGIVVTWLTNVYTWLKDTGKEIWSGIKSGVGSAVTWLENTYTWFTDDFPGKLQSAFQAVATWLYNKVAGVLGWDKVETVKDIPRNLAGSHAGKIAGWAAQSGYFSNTSESTKISSNKQSTTTNNITVDMKGAVLSGVNDFETAVMNAVDKALTLKIR